MKNGILIVTINQLKNKETNIQQTLRYKGQYHRTPHLPTFLAPQLQFSFN